MVLLLVLLVLLRGFFGACAKNNSILISGVSVLVVVSCIGSMVLNCCYGSDEVLASIE